MLDGFMMYLLSAAGDILNQEHTRVHQDMSQPLSHYFISSSHNTYLTRHQIGGTSSTESYVRWVALVPVEPQEVPGVTGTPPVPGH